MRRASERLAASDRHQRLGQPPVAAMRSPAAACDVGEPVRARCGRQRALPIARPARRSRPRASVNTLQLCTTSASRCASSTPWSATSTATSSASSTRSSRPRRPAATSPSSPSWPSPGYPPEDLLLKPGFVRPPTAPPSTRWPPRTGRCAAVVGFVDAGRDLYNAAAVCAGGEVAGRVPQARCCPTTPCSTSSATSRRAPSRSRCTASAACASACRSARTPGARRARSPTRPPAAPS